MNKTRMILILSALVLIGFAVWSISGLATTKIGDIISNPGAFDGKTVRIRGTIDPDTPFFIMGGVYKLYDDSGSIWVVTKNPTPARRTEITVEGKVVGSYKIGSNKPGAVVMEEKRS